MFKKIDIIIKKRKIKKHKKEIKLLEEYKTKKDTCNTCEYYNEYRCYDFYAYGDTIECLLNFKSIDKEEDRTKCQYYKMHKKFKKII